MLFSDMWFGRGGANYFFLRVKKAHRVKRGELKISSQAGRIKNTALSESQEKIFFTVEMREFRI